MYMKLTETISWERGQQWSEEWLVGTCFNPLPSCRLAAELDRWQHPGLNYKLSLAGLLFPSFFSTVSPSETPLLAIYGALFLGKLIMWAQPGCSSTHRPALSHLGRNCSDTPNQSWSGKGSSSEQPHSCTSWPLTPVNILGIILIIIALDFSQRAAKRHPPGPTYWQEL